MHDSVIPFQLQMMSTQRNVICVKTQFMSFQKLYHCLNVEIRNTVSMELQLQPCPQAMEAAIIRLWSLTIDAWLGIARQQLELYLLKEWCVSTQVTNSYLCSPHSQWPNEQSYFPNGKFSNSNNYRCIIQRDTLFRRAMRTCFSKMYFSV